MTAVGSLHPGDLDTVRDAVERLDREHDGELDIATIVLTVDGRGNRAVITWASEQLGDFNETEVLLDGNQADDDAERRHFDLIERANEVRGFTDGPMAENEDL